MFICLSLLKVFDASDHKFVSNLPQISNVFHTCDSQGRKVIKVEGKARDVVQFSTVPKGHDFSSEG